MNARRGPLVAIVACVGVAAAATTWPASRNLLVGIVARDSSGADVDGSDSTAIVRETDFKPRTTSTGTIRLSPGARIAVGAQVSGVVRMLAVQQGSRVRRGDLIAQLDDAEARARLAAAEAREAELSVAHDQAALDLDRATKLAESRVITAQDLANAQFAAHGAAARLDQARAEQALAALQVAHTTIRAPIDGIVATIATHAGETVAASFTTPNFVTLIDPARLECVAFVDESDIGHVAVGDSAAFTVDAYPGREFRGVVDHISPDATIISGVVDFEVTIRLLTGVASLKPQMTASVGIDGPARRTIVIPSGALRQSVAGAYVWLRRAGSQSERVAVRVGARQPDVVQILAGLHAGDIVLTSGFPDTR